MRFEQISWEELEARYGRNNFGVLVIISLWPSEISERSGIVFESGCDNFDYGDAAVIDVFSNDVSFPVVVRRYRGFPDRMTNLEVRLDDILDKEIIIPILKSILEIADNEVFWIATS